MGSCRPIRGLSQRSVTVAVIRRRGRYDGHMLEMWSLGVTLFTLLCGENPFHDVEDTISKALRLPSDITAGQLAARGQPNSVISHFGRAVPDRCRTSEHDKYICTLRLLNARGLDALFDCCAV